VGLKTLVDGCRTYAGTYVRRPQIETAVHILFILRLSETFINEIMKGSWVKNVSRLPQRFNMASLKLGFTQSISPFLTNNETLQLDMTDCEEWEYPIQGREYRRHRLGCNPHTQVYRRGRTTLQTFSFSFRTLKRFFLIYIFSNIVTSNNFCTHLELRHKIKFLRKSKFSTWFDSMFHIHHT
jgi:hypothetical protein